jgi:hypothetical protein
MPVQVGHRRRSQVPGVVRCHRRSRVPGATQWWSHDPDTARQGRGGEILAEHNEDRRRRVRVCESRDACAAGAGSSARVWRGHIVAWPYIPTGARRRGIVGLGYVGRGHHLMRTPSNGLYGLCTTVPHGPNIGPRRAAHIRMYHAWPYGA